MLQFPVIYSPVIYSLGYFFVCQDARDGRADIVKQKLQEFGGNDERLLEAINEGDEGGITPLHYAVRHGHVDVVKLLRKFGAGEQVKNLVIFSNSGNSRFGSTKSKG